MVQAAVTVGKLGLVPCRPNLAPQGRGGAVGEHALDGGCGCQQHRWRVLQPTAAAGDDFGVRLGTRAVEWDWFSACCLVGSGGGRSYGCFGQPARRYPSSKASVRWPAGSDDGGDRLGSGT